MAASWIDRALAIRTVDADDVPTDGKFRTWKIIGATLTPDGDRLIVEMVGGSALVGAPDVTITGRDILAGASRDTLIGADRHVRVTAGDDLTLDAEDAIHIGANDANSVEIGHVGISTNILGTLLNNGAPIGSAALEAQNVDITTDATTAGTTSIATRAGQTLALGNSTGSGTFNGLPLAFISAGALRASAATNVRFGVSATSGSIYIGTDGDSVHANPALLQLGDLAASGTHQVNLHGRVLSIDATTTLGVGTASQTALTMGRTGATTTIRGSTVEITGTLTNNGSPISGGSPTSISQAGGSLGVNGSAALVSTSLASAAIVATGSARIAGDSDNVFVRVNTSGVQIQAASGDTITETLNSSIRTKSISGANTSIVETDAAGTTARTTLLDDAASSETYAGTYDLSTGGTFTGAISGAYNVTAASNVAIIGGNQSYLNGGNSLILRCGSGAEWYCQSPTGAQCGTNTETRVAFAWPAAVATASTAEATLLSVALASGADLTIRGRVRFKPAAGGAACFAFIDAHIENVGGTITVIAGGTPTPTGAALATFSVKDLGGGACGVTVTPLSGTSSLGVFTGLELI